MCRSAARSTELTLKLFSFTFSLSPPGSANVRRLATRLVVDRFAAGRATLRLFAVLLLDFAFAAAIVMHLRPGFWE